MFVFGKGERSDVLVCLYACVCGCGCGVCGCGGGGEMSTTRIQTCSIPLLFISMMEEGRNNARQG